MRPGILASLLLGTLLASGTCQAQWTRVDANTIKLAGDIDGSSYQSYRDAAKGGYSTVILDSAGGSPLPALMIAQDMLKHHPKVVVENKCFSACANYPLLAAPAPVVKCGALIIWHGSPSGDFASDITTMRIERKNPDLIRKYIDWSNHFETLERTFFSQAGVNSRLCLLYTSPSPRD